MIMIIGQVPRRHRGREAFQEINYTRTFDDLTKWVGEVDLPDQIPEFVSRAFHLAMQGRPGPVVLSLPEDVLSAMSDVADAAPAQIAQTGPSDAQMSQLEGLLRRAQRPMIIVGNLGWTPAAANSSTRSSRATTSRLSPASVRRMCWTTEALSMSAISASAAAVR